MKTARKIAGGPRRLEDFDSYVAARDKANAFANDLRAVEAQIEDAQKAMRGFPATKNSAVAAAAEKILAGADIEALLAIEPTDRASMAARIEALNYKRDIIRAAIFQHREAFDRVKEECAAAIFNDIRPEHQRLAATILDHLVALSDALHAEAELRREMTAAGASFSAAPQFTDIATYIGFRQAWASKTNDVWRRVADYIGRAWDHSPVKR